MHGGILMGSAWMVFFWLAMLLVLVWAGVAISRWLPGRKDEGGRDPDGALELLRRRYASGEITTQEYEERLHRLT